MIERLTRPAQLDDGARRALVDCWVAVTNAGGAVGFPFPPVSSSDVAPAVDRLAAELDPDRCVLLRAGDDRRVHGWVVLRRGGSPLVSHWATVERLQTSPQDRGRGIGRALMTSLEDHARSAMGVEQLHLAVRGGTGLEGWYEALGWREVGRWPRALRLAPGDDRDEVLMHKSLRARRRPDVTSVEMVGGTEKRALVLAEYDPQWPAAYAEHDRRIRAALGPAAVRVEHIGSTSVPGLAAKPIIDVLVTVEDITAEEDYVDQLLGAGYELRVREPGHRLVRTPARDAHVHVWEDGDEAVGEYLLFRDRLRTSQEDRVLYERTKRALAEREWPDMNAYADAKTDVVTQIKERARRAEPPDVAGGQREGLPGGGDATGPTSP